MSEQSRFSVALVLAAALCPGLVACGQKGPLTLPKAPEASSAPTPMAPAQPASSPTSAPSPRRAP
ncbi:MAG: LPS translocon maturation chaperone LptM [Rubrivivax sp.]